MTMFCSLCRGWRICSYSPGELHGRPERHVIRLVSITSPVELLVLRQLDIFCVVRRHDPETSVVHVTSLLRSPARQITERGNVAGYVVGDYVYSCPLPPRQHHHQTPVCMHTTSHTIELYKVTEPSV